MRCGRKYPEMGVESTRRNAREGLARTLKKGLKQSFLTDSGKAQSSEMVRGELQSKKSLLILLLLKTLLGSSGKHSRKELS